MRNEEAALAPLYLWCGAGGGRREKRWIGGGGAARSARGSGKREMGMEGIWRCCVNERETERSGARGDRARFRWEWDGWA